MGGRAVEGTGLENRQARERLVGSNPTPSATAGSAQKKRRSLGRASETGSASHGGNTGRHLAEQPDPPVAQGTRGREKPQIQGQYFTNACQLSPQCDHVRHDLELGSTFRNYD